MTDQATRPQALLASALVGLGVAGFFYNGDFTSNEAVHDDVFGLFRANGWENALYVATGAGLLAAGSGALAVAALYLALAIWGFALGGGQSILGIFPVDTADDLLHLGIGLLAVAAAAR